MTGPGRFRRAAVVAVVLLALPARAADPATTCRAAKILRAGLYDACLAKAAARAARLGQPADVQACDAKLRFAWGKIEARAAGACPTSGDASAIAAQVQGDVAAVIAALTPTPTTTTTTLPVPCGGGLYPGCGGACPAGQSCWAKVGDPPPIQSCACFPETAAPCTATGGSVVAGPTCGGACASGETCTTLRIDDSALSATCGCVPAGTTPCISSGQPACGGSCPTGLACAPDPLGLFSCVCQ